MSSAAKKLLERVLALSPDERAAVLDALAGSLHLSTDLTPAWRTEIARRIEALERGDGRLVAWDEVEARALATVMRR